MASISSPLTATVKRTPLFFINKFKKIPDAKWITGDYSGPKAQHCALGHCGESYSDSPQMGMDLIRLLRVISARPDRVNDGGDSRYQQATPKARIIAALLDVQKTLNHKRAN